MIKDTDSSGTFYLLNKTDQKIPIVLIHGVGLTHENLATTIRLL